MSNKKQLPPWARLLDLDIGELNKVNADLFEPRWDEEQTFQVTLSKVISDKYSYDTLSGRTVWQAIVLEVLSGPQIKNEGKTKGRLNTTGLNIDEYPYPYFKDRKDANQAMPVIVKARIPEVDRDLDFPQNVDDKVRIDVHGEFYQYREDEKLSQINAGSIIDVEFPDDKNHVSVNGQPAGKILGVHTLGVVADIRDETSAKKASNPKCQAARNLDAPAGGLYVGHTDEDPNPNIGPPIRKIKGHIKTGTYGNGTAQTKEHFASALRESVVSPKHQIPGAAPGPNNAFIWVGSLKNNGYMDLLDRPLTEGRETIIYAPMTLDLTAPIEIKYYFHDKSGFGHAWINGPETTLDQATNVPTAGNDFKEKVAPGIKDLIKDGRNFILVIPEMSYSRGYGTKPGDVDRVTRMINGERADIGELEKQTIRTRVDSKTRTPVKNYLNGLTVEAVKNVLAVTPLREREFSTFDGSFTGGKFGNFHEEVLDVLDEHLGTVYDKVEFVSILADGLGSTALASMVNNLPFSSTHSEARSSFKSALLGKKLKIDFVTDADLEQSSAYDSYFAGNSPASVVRNEFLLDRSEIGQGYTEFNYIMPTTNKAENRFFSGVDKSKDYKSNSNSTTGAGERKFSFYTVAQNTGPQSFISFHTTPAPSNTNNPASYAFSMVNNFLNETILVKPDANTALKPAFSGVPDHAYALSTKPSVSDLEKLAKKKKELEIEILNFESIMDLTWIVDSPNSYDPVSGDDKICLEYGMFCEDGAFVSNNESLFYKSYKQYLLKKKKYEEIKILMQVEAEIQKVINYKDYLIEIKNDVEVAKEGNSYKLSSTNFFEIAKQLEKEYSTNLTKLPELANKIPELAPLAFSAWYGPGPDDGLWSAIIKVFAEKEAYEKLLTKLKSAISNAGSAPIGKPKDCVDPPQKLGDLSSPPGEIPKKGNSDAPGNNCDSINISRPSTFEELYKMIPYKPKKSEFTFSGRSSKTKTKIHETPGFAVSTFKYLARAQDGDTTGKQSPPLWACITNTVQTAWQDSCQATSYYPFEITIGIRGLQKPKTSGTTAYKAGVSLHSYGLAFDLDPFIAGYSNKPSSPVYSVYTGAWTPGFIEKNGRRLWELGVYKFVPSILKNNAFEAENRPRLTQNWQGAPSRYKGGGESGDAKNKYVKIMNAAKGGPIVPYGADPTSWIILFCEKSGFKWGNGLFLRKRWKGGSRWSQAEKDEISKIFSIPNIVDRVQAISWNSRIEDHMHLFYWGGKSLIPWSQINNFKGVDK